MDISMCATSAEWAGGLPALCLDITKSCKTLVTSLIQKVRAEQCNW